MNAETQELEFQVNKIRGGIKVEGKCKEEGEELT